MHTSACVRKDKRNERGRNVITWVKQRGRIKNLVYERYLTGRIDRATLAEIFNALNNTEPVVRCKDCKHRMAYKNRYGTLIAECDLDTGDEYELGRRAEKDEWFCADGERKEGD